MTGPPEAQQPSSVPSTVATAPGRLPMSSLVQASPHCGLDAAEKILAPTPTGPPSPWHPPAATRPWPYLPARGHGSPAARSCTVQDIPVEKY